MRKKILFLSILFVLFAGHSVQPKFVLPFFDITIVKQSIGGDAAFNFDYNDSYPEVYGSQNLQIQTVNGTGSYSTSTIGGFGTEILLTESPLLGWQNTGVFCESDSSGVTTYPINGGILISTYPYASTTCTFTNVKQSEKTPVLIVPGILGTEVEKGDDLLWLDLNRMFLDIGDNFMDPLQFNIDLISSDTELTIGEVIRKAETGLGLVNFDYTAGLLQEFQSQDYAEGASADSTLFTFPYDWRYGVSGVFNDGKTNVDGLKQKIADIRAQTGSDKVDIVAHSTGGLLVKKYVMEYPDDNHIGKAVFVGAPNLGAPKAIKTLLQGDNFGIPWLADEEMKKIAENLPVAYELLPSQSYFNQNGSFVRVISTNNLLQPIKNLNYDETEDFLLTDHNLNQTAYNGAQNLHTANFDAYDLRVTGIDAYNIVGCKSGTLGEFIENRISNTTTASSNYKIAPASGDGTVPMMSADNLPVNEDNIFYVQKPDHAKMLSADGTRQKIVNIIAGASLDIGDKIISKSVLDDDPSKCQLSGHWFGLFSPVSITITDQNGNRSGVAEDGSIENEIPGADYQVMGEHKFIFLPTDDNQTYSVNLTGTGNGAFTFKDQRIDNGQAGQTETFINIPVTTSGSGQVNLGASGEATTISFDSTGSGNMETILPSAVLNAEQSNDITPPVITIISPTAKDYLRSENFVINAASTDANPGVFSFDLALDGEVATSGEPIDLFFEKLGNHSLVASSTDFVGNTSATSTQFRIIATPESTISDIERAYLLGWITKKQTKNTLIARIKTLVRIEKRIEIIEEKLKNGKKKITRLEKRIDKVLARAFQLELKLYQKNKLINEQAHKLLQEDIQWLIDNY